MPSPSNPEPIRIAMFSNVPDRVERLSTMFKPPIGHDTFDVYLIEGDVDQIPPSEPFQCLMIDLEGFQNPLNLIRQIRQSRPSLFLIIIDSRCAGELIVNAVLAGVRGCIDPYCDSSTAHQVVKDVLAGLLCFSPQVMSRVIGRLLESHGSEG